MLRFVHALVFALVASLGIASGAHTLGSESALRENFASASDRVGALALEALETRQQNPAAATTLASECSYAARGGTQAARALGQAGEKTAQIIKNAERIPSASGTAAYRIPDALDHAVSVKEVVA